jgi:hypothetical protein
MSGRRHISAGRVLLTGLAIAILAGLLPVGAAAEEGPHRFVTLSLFDPVTTSQDRNTTSNFRLAIIESHLRSVRGLDITGIAGVLEGELKGIQATGIYSNIEGPVTGIVATGIVSNVVGEFRGLHVAGIGNFNQAEFRGIQFAGVLNFTSGGFTGLQWSSTMNMNDGPGTGWQLSAAANAVNGRYVGLQTAMFYNFANLGLKGAQVGGMNWTRDLEGAQVGLLNLAAQARGLQLGVVNVAEKNDGIPVGLVNLAGNGHLDWLTWGSNYMGVETALRSRVGHWYSLLSVGGVYTPDTELDVASLGWHYGYRFEFSQRLSLSVDAGYLHLMPDKDPALDDRLRPAAQGRAFLEFGLGRFAAIHAGVGGTVEWEAYESGAGTESDPLFFGGISLFGGEE